MIIKIKYGRVIRQHYDIPQNVRLFVHGGKLNEAKKTDAIISAMLENAGRCVACSIWWV